MAAIKANIKSGCRLNRHSLPEAPFLSFVRAKVETARNCLSLRDRISGVVRYVIVSGVSEFTRNLA